jgi:hypothetical protein
MRLRRPFVTLLQRYPSFPAEVLGPLQEMDADERLPIAVVLELLRGAIELTGDPDLGLKAAREISVGDYGALQYAATSASRLASGAPQRRTDRLVSRRALTRVRDRVQRRGVVHARKVTELRFSQVLALDEPP